MITFTVPGTPAPGGSKKAFVVAGRAHLIDDAKHNAPWRSTVALAAKAAMAGDPPLDGPLFLEITFTLPRPKSHYRGGRRGGVLTKSAPPHPTGKPDVTKLVRALEDALKNICWFDDSQVVSQWANKVYGEEPGAAVGVGRVSDEEIF